MIAGYPDEDLARLAELERDVGLEDLVGMLAAHLRQRAYERVGRAEWNLVNRAAGLVEDARALLAALWNDEPEREVEAPRCVPHGAIWCSHCAERGL